MIFVFLRYTLIHIFFALQQPTHDDKEPYKGFNWKYRTFNVFGNQNMKDYISFSEKDIDLRMSYVSSRWGNAYEYKVRVDGLERHLSKGLA